MRENKKLKVLYISNIRKIKETTIWDGDDAHLWHSIKSFYREDTNVYLDSDFYEPFFFNPFHHTMKILVTKKSFLSNSFDHFLNILKIPLFDIPRIQKVLQLIKPHLIYERTKFFRFFNLHKTSTVRNKAQYFVEVEAPIQELKDINCDSLFYKLAEKIEYLKYIHAHAIFTVTETLKQHLINTYGLDPNKIFVIHNAAHTKVFYPDLNLKIQRRRSLGICNDIVIGFVGAAHLKWHNLETLCESISILSKRVKNLKLLLVGLEKDDIISRSINIAPIEDKILFLGNRSPSEVNAFINAMDICVLPGTNWYCSPMKLFEYGVIGKPVVVVDMPNIREIVPKDDIALFINSGDSFDLAEKLFLLCNNEELRRELGRRFQQHVLKNFNWDKNVDKIFEVYIYLKKNRIDIS